MKKFILLLMVIAIAITIEARTLRVNNVESEGAPYLTAVDAIAVAADGDVIILEASPKSYGDITVDKAITLRGEGYFLDVNGIGNEGAASTNAGTITVNATNATISSISAYQINANADNVTVTRCNVQSIVLGLEYSYKENSVKNCVIHQNFIRLSLNGDSYSGYPSGIQITNNIFVVGDDSSPNIWQITNSTFAYNTFRRKANIGRVENCTFDHNIGRELDRAGNTNTYLDNTLYEDNKTYTSCDSKSDTPYKEIDKSLTSKAGAFAGEDPYRLSGRPAAPSIELLEVPTSVVQGKDLKVSVKIGLSE